MYNIKINNVTDKYEFNELIKIFLKPDEFTVYGHDEVIESEEGQLVVINEEGYEDKNLIKRDLFSKLSLITGSKPDWGILTGVRPVKLTGELVEKHGSIEAVEKLLKDFYFFGTDF